MKVLAEHHASLRKSVFGYMMGKSGVPLLDRAVEAYRSRPAHHFGEPAIEPRAAQHVELDGKEYVVLWRPGVRDCIMFVYRVRAYDGILRAMKRWPSGLNDLTAERLT
jgi:hypothetical protein